MGVRLYATELGARSLGEKLGAVKGGLDRARAAESSWTEQLDPVRREHTCHPFQATVIVGRPLAKFQAGTRSGSQAATEIPTSDYLCDATRAVRDSSDQADISQKP